MAEINQNSMTSKMKEFENIEIKSVKQVPSPIEEVILANALSLRDTTSHYFPNNLDYNNSKLDVSLYGEKAIYVNNKLNQNVSVIVYGDTQKNGTNGDGNFVIVSSEVLNAGAKKYFHSLDYKAFGVPIQSMVVQISCATAPTTGTVTVKFEGIKRNGGGFTIE